MTKPYRNYPANGWAPLPMRCPECEGPDAHCLACGGTGFYADSHVLSEGLFIDHRLHAKLEAFADPGPFYAKALGPDGDYHYSAASTHTDAAEWCETMTGYRASARSTTDANKLAAKPDVCQKHRPIPPN